MSISEKYNCWAAAQYRDKLSAEVEGRDWSPSAPPVDSPSRPSSAQSLRKSRTANRGIGSPSPLGQHSNPSSTSLTDSAYERRTASERYFASLGDINASRPEHRPPSQGGKYQGFGNTPAYPSSSSASAPSFSDEPMQALSRGWGLLSSAVAATSRKVYETATDPALHEQIKGYADTARKTAVSAAGTANQWGKQRLGVDVADHVGAVVDKVKDATGIGAAGPGGGYQSVSGYGGYDDDHSTRLYADDGDDFFEVHTDAIPAPPSSSMAPRNTSNPAKKANNWDDDEWKDF